MKTPKLQIVKQKTLKIHESKACPPLFTPKKENEDPKNDKKKIENLQKNLKNKKIPQSSQNEIQKPHAPHRKKEKKNYNYRFF